MALSRVVSEIFSVEKYRDLEIPVKSQSRSLKVVPVERLGDFLLTLYSNNGPISYRFRDRRRFRSKIAKFSNPLYFAPPLKGFPLELDTSAGGQKTRMMGCRADKEV